MRILTMLLVCAVSVFPSESQPLGSKVIRLALNQNEPAIIKLGTDGITTLEFPYKIEALDGYGFGVSPSPNGQDLFQISFNKGTNFLSLKALRTGVEGNLAVVLDGKVYSLFCTAVADPTFVVVFEDRSAKTTSNPREVLTQKKQATPARLLGFLDKVKAYPSLKVSAPEIFQNMEVAEPNSESSLEGLKVTLRRVIRDDGLDSLGFDVELANRSNRDFYYDPESLGVRVGEEVYPEIVSDAGGIVEAGKTLPAFFVVAGTATEGRNDLAVTNQFSVVMRQIIGEKDTKNPVERKEPANAGPMAQSVSQAPMLPALGSGPSERSMVADNRKARKSHRRKRKSPVTPAEPKENYASRSNQKVRTDEAAAEEDE
jgi:hypothetical protein